MYNDEVKWVVSISNPGKRSVKDIKELGFEKRGLGFMCH